MAQAQTHYLTKTGEAGQYSRSTTDTITAIELTEQDKWLLNNPKTMEAIKRGLADSAAGRGVKMSFLEFAEDDTDS